MRLSRRELLTALGFGALSACAGAQGEPQGDAAPAKPVEPSKESAAQELGKRKALQAAANQLGVTQASFERRFAAGLKPTGFAKLVRGSLGVGLVSWSGPLMGATDAAAIKALRAANDENSVRTLLVDPAIGPGLASPDAAARAAAIEKLKPWFEVVRGLGGIGVSLDLRGEGDFDTQLARSLEGARALLPALRQAGLQGVVKCLGGYTSDGQFLAALMNQLNDPAVRLEPTFDSWKVSEGETYHRVRGIELLMPFAACVLADYTEFKPDGDSTVIPTRMMVMRVRNGGFRGPVMMQFKGPGDELEGTLKIKKLLTRYPFQP